MIESKFYIGQIINHIRFNYRGVIVEIDPIFSNSNQWYEQMAVTQPPKNKPWYNVLVDQSSDITYVAQRNLISSENMSQIEHPLLGRYFNKYDGKRYFIKAKLS
ncbi:DNA-binding protein [Pseudoalteromonas sp. NBT06-2]|uniref:heat shock protein HspQ n=1 Tax=Pseudoalteromonas sp. NBT06-2 TaxID=2025950 RepID=UPI000BA6C5B6|nr:heat shock protein HspQ [Pseudoalteromonas sp. NBT06-2]PAJ74322.1 DNA-binding protein [Pseudoalteromonas sp. NBT06-2]